MKLFITYSFLTLITVGTLFGADRILYAQNYNPIVGGDIQQQISTSVSPENPAPGQEVRITLSAYGTNLNNATITWTVNGAQALRGVGQAQFSLNAGNNGEVKRVVATISPESGPVITRTFTISAQDVSIVYESDGYVPPFYKGKGLYGREGTVTLVAMPNLISASGAKLNPSTLTYKWIVDGTVQGSKSGYGKNSFVYKGNILGKEVIIQAEVSNAAGDVSGKGTVILNPQAPEVLVYEKNPLYGTLFNRELGSNGLVLKEKETTVEAVPFSTSALRSNQDTLRYGWMINGSSIPVPESQNYATFRNSTGQQGISLIGVSVANSTHLLQQMRSSLSINF